MSSEGDRETVFHTTKVRTKLKGDGSWMQRQAQAEAAPKEEKPWIAEVRASRLNGAPTESSPVSSPIKPTPEPTKPATDRTQKDSGFLIRGVFIKTDSKPATSSTFNGISGTKNYGKKVSDGYKKIAPHTVRPTPENQEGSLSPEEKEKRTEAASSVLKKSAVRQRSYVLSAAKRYESREKAPDTAPINSSLSFVAKRVEITDEDESAVTPATVPEPKSQTTNNTTVKAAVDEPLAPKVEDAAPEPVKGTPSPVPVLEKDPFADMKPGCTKVATPLPELVVECLQEARRDQEPDDILLVKPAPESTTPVSPTLVSPTPVPPTLVSPTPKPAPRVPPTLVSPTPEPASRVPPTLVSPTPEPAALVPPTLVSPTPVPPTLVSPTPEPAAPVPPTLVSPTPKPNPCVPPTLVSPTPEPAAPEPPTLVSPTPEPAAPGPPTLVSPTPVPPTLVSTTPEPAAPVSPTPEPAALVSPTPEPPTLVSHTPEPAALVPPTLVSPTPEPAALVPPTLVSPTPEPAALLSPTPEPAALVSPTPEPPTLVSPTPEPDALVPTTLVSPTPEPAALVPTTLVSPTPEPAALVPPTLASPTPEPAALLSPTPVAAAPDPEPKSSPTISANVDTFAALSDSLISFDTCSTSPPGSLAENPESGVIVPVPNSFMDDQPGLLEEEDSLVQIQGGAEHEPTPALSECIPITDDLLAFTDGPEEPTEPVPPSPGRWSQDLLGELDSNPAKTAVIFDHLADDVIPINTEARSLSDAREEEKLTDETAGETQSPTETVTGTTKTVIITDQSSVDPFDPYPMRPTSHNSMSNLSSTMESLADPINTDTKSLGTWRSWASSWDPSTPQLTQSQEDEPESRTEDQQTLVGFERKSSENDSPWDKWMTPTIYTVTTTTEEEEEEERPEDTEMQTVTTIRETYSEPEPAVDRTSREDQTPEAPEAPQPRKNFVYLKEYVSTSELSLHNAEDGPGSGSDYLTSSSTSYSYSSPSTYSSDSLSSSCTYCGELVGNDAKITIEHLNINCHPDCFKCGVCSKPMGDFLTDMFLHGGKVYCESCYSKALD